MRRGGLLLLPLLLVSACAGLHRPGPMGDPIQAQQQRESRSDAQSEWSFSGRVALSLEGEGGTGRLEWRRSGASVDIRLSVPVSRQGWQLTGQSGDMNLRGSDGVERRGADAGSLLREATGWALPLEAFERWVRGARHDPATRIEFDADGRPKRFDELGWTVEYLAWDPADPWRPARLRLSDGRVRVRLAIDRWESP